MGLQVKPTTVFEEEGMGMPNHPRSEAT